MDLETGMKINLIEKETNWYTNIMWVGAKMICLQMQIGGRLGGNDNTSEKNTGLK